MLQPNAKVQFLLTLQALEDLLNFEADFQHCTCSTDMGRKGCKIHSRYLTVIGKDNPGTFYSTSDLIIATRRYPHLLTEVLHLPYKQRFLTAQTHTQ